MNPTERDLLIEAITRQVMASLRPEVATGPAGAAIPGSLGCSQCQGHCVVHCAEAARQVIAAGASRVGSGLGIGAVSQDLAGMIDHTLLKPEATRTQIEQLCTEARQFQFASVCVNPAWVRLCARLLAGSPVLVCTVVGFPLGATLPEVKAFETRRAIRYGAEEIDMVINIGALKSGDHELVERDIMAVVDACREEGAVSKVIIEAALLTDAEKETACLLAKSAGADFVKTSTGFGPGGATVADVALMRRVVGPEMGIKAAGGIRTLADAEKMIAAGASRIGASASVKIMQEKKGQRQT